MSVIVIVIVWLFAADRRSDASRAPLDAARDLVNPSPPMRRRLPLALAALAALAACAADPSAPPAGTSAPAAANAPLPDRDPALAHKLVAEGGLLIDVRSKEEFADQHAQGAINIPVNELESRLGEVDKLAGGDKNKGIVVYCAMGGRAGTAKKALTKAGFTRVTNVGGLRDWEKK